ncbi:ferredoxin [Archangium primigenium]|uniref:ferredoxin n=1 Tax=[Archangium] primigenium TaxID=2792470 RepID=UPI00195D0AFF|nr:ferredoxin [Archangium primigenium]MBM7116115.1 ferredoxin [Archangium primigenium]
MKIVVDWGRCEANGVCVREAPDVFELNDKDELQVLSETVSPGARARVDKAIYGCPKQALSLSEE